MTQEQELILEPRVQQSVDEVRQTICQRYPEARFTVSHGIDDPAQVHLTTEVDIDDPDEVLDLVLDRLLELEIDEGIPLYLIPIRTPERALASRQAEAHPLRHRLRQSPVATELPPRSR